jgi:putative phosphoribosyl transferase
MTTRYFKNRAEAGRLIAEELKGYEKQHCAVVALSPGAVLVGAQIAMQLHASLAVLMTEQITLPGELEPLAAITSDNTFTYNNKFSAGEIEAMHSEYLGVIESQRIEKLHKLHVLLGKDGEVRRELLNRHTVIVVSDGLQNGMSLDIAQDFLKPVHIEKLVIVTPIASVHAVDKMHLIGDGLVCLSVPADYMNTDHYYEDNVVPDAEGIFKIISSLPVHWDRM